VPITKAVHDLLYEELPLSCAIDALLERTPHEEFYGVDPSAHAGEES
jgi:hypothetical protein